MPPQPGRILQGAPPNQQPIPGGELPVWDTTLRGLHNAKPCIGEVDIAYRLVGLASTMQNPNAPKPSAAQLDDYLRRLVWYASQPAAANAHPTAHSNRRRKLRLLLQAILALRGIRNQRWDLNRAINIDEHDNAALHINWTADGPTPLPWPAIDRKLELHLKSRDPRLAQRIKEYEPLASTRLTQRELEAGYSEARQRLVRHWDTVPVGGFLADAHSTRHKFRVMNWPEDGNSLWYCLWYVNSLVHKPFLGDEQTADWAHIKGSIWKYFNYVIHHPSHIRHRMYVHLERKSWGEIGEQAVGDEKILWGRMSILRALHMNAADSGPPMYGHFQGMMQVIADFFQQEVVLFIRPQGTILDDPIEEGQRLYPYRVFGRLYHGRENGQIFLVTDSNWEQFQVVIAIDNIEVPYGRVEMHLFNTLHAYADHRFGWIEAPWMVPRPLGILYEPNTNFIIKPIEDVRNHLSHREKNQFEGGGMAVSDDDRYSFGRFPILPSPVAAGWRGSEVAPADEQQSFPYPFYRRLIVTGTYLDQNMKERWPQWNNIHAYRAEQYQRLAKARGLPTERHELSAHLP